MKKLGRALRLESSYRYPSTQNPDIETINGVPNWYFQTDTGSDKLKTLTMGRGIWSPSAVRRSGIKCNAVIICTTAPHRAGSFTVPWSDIIKPAEGWALYFGDNKIDKEYLAEKVIGNRTAMESWELQHSNSREDRLKAAPVVLVSSHGESGQGKGFRKIEGLCAISRADFVLQRDPKSGKSFRNIRFELMILDLKDNNDEISMDWINARRDSNTSLENSYDLAPDAWKRLIDRGSDNLEPFRRRVFQKLVIPDYLQALEVGSELENIRKATLNHFSRTPHDFEKIGARVTERILQSQGLRYKTAWITPKSSDGGLDFVGSIDLNPIPGFHSSKHVVVGQAKCEDNKATGGDALARLVARMRRGWHGVYVTTSKFSTSVQKEIIADRAPVVLINGLQVAATIRDELNDSGLPLIDYLDFTVSDFAKLERNLDPDMSLLL